MFAKIGVGDGTQIDSIQLLDDGSHNDEIAGDGIYANSWPVVPSEESHYYVDLQVTRIDTDTVIKQFNNVVRFTTMGPVTYAEYSFKSDDDTAFYPGDNRKGIKLTLKNDGSTAAAPNIKAELTSLDVVASISYNSCSFGDIAAGDVSISNLYWNVTISEDCPVNTQIPVLVEIMSDDFSSFQKGVYLITIKSKDSVTTSKIIKL